MKRFCRLLLLALFITQCRHKQNITTIQFPGKPEVPLSVKKEHEDLPDKIQKITLFRDSAGRAALKLNELMKYHFAEEEDYVLPPLGLLPLLASGKIPEQSKEILLLTEKLKSQMLHLSAEHQMIKA
jgi:hypothetical protein